METAQTVSSHIILRSLGIFLGPIKLKSPLLSEFSNHDTLIFHGKCRPDLFYKQRAGAERNKLRSDIEATQSLSLSFIFCSRSVYNVCRDKKCGENIWLLDYCHTV